MTSIPVSTRRRTSLFTALLLTALFSLSLLRVRAEEPAVTFSKPVIDVGIVVSDLDKAAQFYTNVIGFREIPGFNVPAAMGKKIGLTDSRAVNIRVFELGEGDSATKIKLMSFPDVAVTKPERKFIHSTMGLNYLTIYVGDMTQSLRLLKAGGVKLLVESPVELGGGPQRVTLHDPDGTFIELGGPAKKP